ncbi:MAG: linalool 8-monooxygenase [Acidimicrobiia bacterium]|nr:MAG: linalool 8-monooxygenase [Acidimicrobiia bacterium]
MTTVAPTTALALEDIRLGELETWMRPDREGIFAKLRDEAPVSFHAEPVPPPESTFPQGPGFWAVTRYADVMQVSRDPDTFRSAPSVNIPDIPPEIAEWLGSMINMDAPKHTKLRLIVNRGFTPRQVARIEETVRRQAAEIVDRVAPMGECDFVAEIAAALPLQIICDMMGIPREDNRRIFELTNVILGVGDPEYVQSMDDLVGAGMELFQYGLALAEDRLANPRDDITTALMHAEIEDEQGRHRLSASELGSFFLLLVVAGNETTRNAISHGMLALTEHPDQRRHWVEDFDAVAPSAVEEIVRWATPVIHFRRTAARDTVVGGQEIRAGEKVVMFYNSANRDERHFPDPYRFDVTRTPNEHVGFGAGGPHFCLGANLARREIRVMFEELLRRLPDIEVTGEPAMLQSAFIHGIKRMPCAWHTVR